MTGFEKIFDEDTVESISNLVESKMPLLNKVPEFKKKDKTLANFIEQLENVLSLEQNAKLNDVMRLHYQIDSYYFTLAYFLGKQHAEQIEKL